MDSHKEERLVSNYFASADSNKMSSDSDTFYNSEVLEQCEVLELVNDKAVHHEFFNNSFEVKETGLFKKPKEVVIDQHLLQSQTSRGLKRKLPNEPPSPDCIVDQDNPINTETTSNNLLLPKEDQIICDLCEVMVSRRFFSNHLKTAIHRNKSVLTQHGDKIMVLNTAFGSRILTYRIVLPQKDDGISERPELFYESVKDKIAKIVEDCLESLTFIKVNFILHTDFVHNAKATKRLFDCQTSYYTLSIGDDLESYYKVLGETFKTKISEYEKRFNGWSFEKIRCLQMNVNKCNLLR